METTKPKTSKISINGKEMEVANGTSVFQAASNAGIFIPHYCYHVDLSVAGVCRMCMVEIEKNPRLQISCNTPVVDGMVVRTDTQKVKDAVKNTLELHLINHPIDCPICDKAGECKLQDFYAKYGLYESRMEYDKVHKGKAVDIGTIMLDQERCILCTRCVRFTAEVTKTSELGIFNRGDRSELRTYDHGPLKNDYTGNLADICPVGALTAKDFRFRQRVWFLEKTESVCGMCARGCNTALSVNPNTKKLFRVEPRRNPDVNKSWICDTGRWGYHFLHAENRVTTPKRRISGVLEEVTWNDALSTLSDELNQSAASTLVGLSTFMTNEEIADCVQTFGALGVKKFAWIVDENVVDEKTPFDGILRHRDTTPNAEGFKQVMAGLGIQWLKQKQVNESLKAGEVSLVMMLGLEGHALPGAAAFLGGRTDKTKVVIHATNDSPLNEVSALVLPNVSAFEKTGTFINALGRMQKVNAALPPQFTARDAHAVAFGAAQGSDRQTFATSRVREVFDSVIGPKVLKREGTNFRKFPAMGISLTEGQKTNVTA